MSDFILRHLARFLARPRVADAIIRYAQQTPYMHLPSNEDPSYMMRWWVFNPYNRHNNKPRFRWCPWSIRVHHIRREDSDRVMHDHPWNARTFILKGWYIEVRENPDYDDSIIPHAGNWPLGLKWRRAGDTAKLGFGEYHAIREVSDGGVYTLFISGPWQGVWGFLVNGVKVPWRTYLNLEKQA